MTRSKAVPSMIQDHDLIDAFFQYSGDVKKVAEHFGVKESSLRNYICQHLHLKEAKKESRALYYDRLLDKAEDALERKIDEGSTQEIIFALRSQGKERGWSTEKKDDDKAPDTIKIICEEAEPKPKALSDSQNKKKIREDKELYKVLG